MGGTTPTEVEPALKRRRVEEADAVETCLPVHMPLNIPASVAAVDVPASVAAATPLPQLLEAPLQAPAAYGACSRLKCEWFCHLCDMTQNMGCTTNVHHCSHTALREALCSDDAGRCLPNQMRAIWTYGMFVAWVCAPTLAVPLLSANS